MAVDTSKKIQEILDLLKKLAENSKSAATNITVLENTVNKLANVKVENFKTFSKDLDSFLSRLKDFGMIPANIEKVANSLKSLGKASLMDDFNKNFHKVNEETQDAQKVVAGYTAELRRLKAEMRAIGNVWQQTISPKSSSGAWSALGKLDLKGAERAAKSLPPEVGKQLLADYTKVRNLLQEIQRLQELIKAPPGRPYTEFAESLLPGGRKGRGIDVEGGGQQEVPQVVGAEFIKSLGLSEIAAKKLNDRLESMGMTGAKVTSSFKDLNTGMHHIKMTSDESSGAMRRFTAVIDDAGNVVNTTQNRYRSFASGVARDIVEVLKWTIAIGAVYGPIKKLNELLEESRKIQTDLIDVQISLGRATADLQGIFDASVDIANQTSSAVEGVIEGYTLAVAAAGSVAGESERLASTQLLVRDSMVLAKLAGLQQKEALDTLVGSLRQAGLELTQGMRLLDSWVAVSRNANVSINQLASTFAIVGTAAENVGLNFSELNALAATMAESTKLSADEVGNAIRGIIATMQTDKAAGEFAKYGLATKNVTGELKNMMDILTELSLLQQAGVLDEKAMSALTQAGGGGARRGAQLATLVENMSRVMEIIAVSEAASGDAAEALELKMSTLESAIQRLNNSFSALAQSLGMEGGVIGAMTTGVEIITKMVDGVKELVSMLKWAAPILGASGFIKLLGGTQTGSRFLGQQLPPWLAQILTPTLATQEATGQDILGVQPGIGSSGGFLTNALVKMLQGTGWGYTPSAESGKYQINTIGGLLSSILETLRRGEKETGISVASLLTPLLLMGTSIGQKDAGARLTTQGAGTAAGLVMSALTKSPIWTSVGTLIATGFYEKFLTFEEDIVKEWIIARESSTSQGGTPEERAQHVQDMLIDSLSWTEKFSINWRKFWYNAAVGLGDLYEGLNVESPLAGIEGQLTQSTAMLSIYQQGGFSEKTRDLFEQLWEEYILGVAEGGLEGTATYDLYTTNAEKLAELAGTTANELMQQSLEDLAEGASGSIGRYLELKQAPTQFQTAGAGLITAQQLLTRTAPGTKVMGQEEAINFVAGLGTEDRQIIAQLTSDVIQSTAGLERLRDTISTSLPDDVVERWDKITETFGILAGYKFILPRLGMGDADPDRVEDWTNKISAYVDAIQSAASELPVMIPAMQQRTGIATVAENLMSFIDIPDDLTSEQRQAVIAGAESLWREYIMLSENVTEEMMEQYIKVQEDQLIRANNEILGITTKVPQWAIDMQAQQMGVGGAAGAAFGLMDLRDQYTKAEFTSQLMPRYLQVLGAITRNFPDYKVEGADTGFILKDGFDTQHVDMTLLQLAMQDLIEINREKGLEGIYNLPEGATFMIPIQAFQLDRETRYNMNQGGAAYYPEDVFTGQIPAIGTGVGPGEPSFPEYKTSIVDLVQALRDRLAREEEVEELRPVNPLTGWSGIDPGEAPYPASPEYGYGSTMKELVDALKGFSSALDGATLSAENWAETALTTPTGPGIPFSDAEGAIASSIAATTPVEDTRTSAEKVNDWLKGIIEGALDLFPSAAEAIEGTSFGQWMNRRYQEMGLMESEQPYIGTGETGITTGGKVDKSWWLDVLKSQNEPLLMPEKMKTAAETQAMAPAPISLNLDIESTAQLVVDGRTLATVIKPYLYADLLRFSASSNSSINRNVVA